MELFKKKCFRELFDINFTQIYMMEHLEVVKKIQMFSNLKNESII